MSSARELTPLQIALRLLEQGHANGVAHPLETVETVLPSLGIHPGSEDHFLLVYRAQQFLRQEDGHRLPSPMAFGRRFPQWQSRAEQMARLEESLDTIRTVCGDLIRSTLEEQGWKLIHPIKEGDRRRIHLARRKGDELEVVKASVGMDSFGPLKREFLLGRRLPARAFVPTTGFGVAGEVSWFSMEFADGGTLANAGRPGGEEHTPTSLRQVWRWWRETARALAMLHRQNLCHNDLKASNIFLHTTPTGRHRARVGDLQLVSRDGGRVAREPDQWDHPRVVENGTAHRADDIYRLAMTILWLLDGRAAEGDHADNGRRLRLAGAQPAPFREPLVACLRDRRSERVDNGMELCRALMTARQPGR